MGNRRIAVEIEILCLENIVRHQRDGVADHTVEIGRIVGSRIFDPTGAVSRVSIDRVEVVSDSSCEAQVAMTAAIVACLHPEVLYRGDGEWVCICRLRVIDDAASQRSGGSD